MDSEALQLAKSTAEAVQELRAEMQELRAAVVKNAEEFKVFKDAAMGALQALSHGSAPAAVAPGTAAPPSPAPTVPLSPSPTVPLSSAMAALPAIAQTEAAASDEDFGATAESQPLVAVRNVRLKRRHLGARNSGQDATESEKPAHQPATVEGILKSLNATGANDANAAQRPYRCEECGKTFTRKFNLKSHMLSIHPEEKPYPCDKCDKAFATQFKLEAHMRLHTGKRPFKCDECGDAFKEKYSLISHMPIHTGEKPYQCAECGMKFARKSSLTRHMRRHTGEKPYTCSICDKACSEMSDLKKHMRRHHSGEKP